MKININTVCHFIYLLAWQLVIMCFNFNIPYSPRMEFLLWRLPSAMQKTSRALLSWVGLHVRLQAGKLGPTLKKKSHDFFSQYKYKNQGMLFSNIILCTFYKELRLTYFSFYSVARLRCWYSVFYKLLYLQIQMQF